MTFCLSIYVAPPLATFHRWCLNERKDLGALSPLSLLWGTDGCQQCLCAAWSNQCFDPAILPVATDNVKDTTRTWQKIFSVWILIVLTQNMFCEFTYMLSASACSCPLRWLWLLFCPGMGCKNWRKSSSKITKTNRCYLHTLMLKIGSSFVVH